MNQQLPCFSDIDPFEIHAPDFAPQIISLQKSVQLPPQYVISPP